MTKSGREIMEILEAFDLTRCAHSAAELARTDRKTVARYVALRDAGVDPAEQERRPRSIDPFLHKVVSEGTVRIHLQNIYARLQISNRTAAVTKAFPGNAGLA